MSGEIGVARHRARALLLTGCLITTPRNAEGTGRRAEKAPRAMRGRLVA